MVRAQLVPLTMLGLLGALLIAAAAAPLLLAAWPRVGAVCLLPLACIAVWSLCGLVKRVPLARRSTVLPQEPLTPSAPKRPPARDRVPPHTMPQTRREMEEAHLAIRSKELSVQPHADGPIEYLARVLALAASFIKGIMDALAGPLVKIALAVSGLNTTGQLVTLTILFVSALAFTGCLFRGILATTVGAPTSPADVNELIRNVGAQLLGMENGGKFTAKLTSSSYHHLLNFRMSHTRQTHAHPLQVSHPQIDANVACKFMPAPHKWMDADGVTRLYAELAREHGVSNTAQRIEAAAKAADLDGSGNYSALEVVAGLSRFIPPSELSDEMINKVLAAM